MTVFVDRVPASIVRFLDASMAFHPVVNPAFAEPTNFTVRRPAPRANPITKGATA